MAKTEPALLNEGGIAITASHVAASGKSFAWKELGIVRIQRTGTLISKIFSPTFCLVIATKKNPNPFILFETKDPELVNRIKVAIDTVGRRLGARKEV